MDVANDTPYDVTYKVAGGGTPMGHHGRFNPSEEASRWPVIAANTVVNVPIAAKGPWWVYFVINGEGFVAELKSDNDFVHLAPSGNSFQTDVRRVPHATHKPVDLSGHA